jgi:hypothetical protein
MGNWLLVIDNVNHQPLWLDHYYTYDQYSLITRNWRALSNQETHQSEPFLTLQGKSSENGEPVVDLLADENKQKTSNGLFINASIVDLSLIGTMKGKSLSDLVSSINEGNNYVNVHTQSHPDGEIRGQLELSGSANMTSAAGNETDTDTESETAIVTPTNE